MLSRFFVNSVRDNITHFPQHAITAAISFDFRYILEREKGGAKGLLLRALLYQILENDPSVFSGSCHSFDSISSIPERPEDLDYRVYQRYLRLALSAATNNANVFIVIDGLDECDPDVQDDVMACIEPIYNTPNFLKKVRVVVASRWVPSMQRVHEEERTKKIDLDMENSQDIAKFCSAMLWSRLIDPEMITDDHNASDQDILRHHLQYLVDALTHRANGMFLWVSLAINSLLTEFPVQRPPIYSTEKWQKAIQDLPADLDLFYEAFLDRIPSKLNSTLQLVFSWLLFAARPLTTDELHTALEYCTRRNDQEQGDELHLDWISRIEGHCWGLIEVVSDPLSDTKHVQFIHRTARDFLTGSGERYVMPTGLSHTLLAETCIQSMKGRLYDGSGNHHLLDYCEEHWGYHASAGDKLGITQEYLLDFFHWPSTRSISVRLYRYPWFKSENLRTGAAKRISFLHIASQYGLLNTIQALPVRASASIYWDQIDDIGRTPLHFACRHGHVDVATTLLEHGAHINSTDHYKRTPLYLASQSGHEEIVRLLLRQGASVGSADSYNKTPLLWAFQTGKSAIINELLRHGANTNDIDSYGNSILTLATASGKEDVAKFALSLKTTQWPSASLGIALVFAAALGLQGVVRSLLQLHRFVGFRNSFVEQAFIAAIVCASEEMVVTFLDFGCQIDIYDHQHGQSALSIAAASGHERLVKTLLQYGANPNIQDIRTGKTPVMHAISRGYPTIVALLVNQGARIELPKRPGIFADNGWMFRVVSALIRKCPSGGNGTGKTQKSATSSKKGDTGLSDRGRASERPSGSRRKRSRSERTPDGNEEDSEDGRAGRKRTCKEVEGQYACPYQKRYPDQHACRPKSSVSRIK